MILYPVDWFSSIYIVDIHHTNITDFHVSIVKRLDLPGILSSLSLLHSLSIHPKQEKNVPNVFWFVRGIRESTMLRSCALRVNENQAKIWQIFILYHSILSHSLKCPPYKKAVLFSLLQICMERYESLFASMYRLWWPGGVQRNKNLYGEQTAIKRADVT